tara:strand:- start:430 stop:606 length:177 start_codon:yes stop_codon:yes gene_type:complete
MIIKVIAILGLVYKVKRDKEIKGRPIPIQPFTNPATKKTKAENTIRFPDRCSSIKNHL